MFILDSILVIIFTVHIYFVGIFNLFFLFPGRINQKEKKSSEIQLPSPGKVIKTWKHFESEGAATLCRTTVREEINDVLCEQERKKTLTQCYPATHDAAQQLALLMTKMSGLTCLEMTCSRTRAENQSCPTDGPGHLNKLRSLALSPAQRSKLLMSPPTVPNDRD